MELSSPKSSSSSQVPPPRACATCRKFVIPYFLSFMKNCDQCRAANRKKKQQAADRKRQREAAIAKAMKSITAIAHERPATPPVPRPTPVEQKENRVDLRATVVARPKKRPALHELEGEAHNAARNQMKSRIQALTKASKTIDSKALLDIPHGTSHSSPSGKEYQTATALYESLKKRSSNASILGRKINFNGYHVIVAVSTIDHLKRIDMVTNDLRKLARLSFDYTKPNHSYDFKTMARTASFQCTCLCQKSPSSLETRLMGSTSGPSTPKLCGGIVTITAVDDTTHPLDILGQRIRVRVEHK
ncbi:hypothetical protein BDN70DRAFT_996337 [Pholiota conissans]|uniref:Uncharacterized protein n=1 Tax=Pholiota conissans TaxID=109636 RepID=A0A9P5YVS0_9AGAR|nr:hypothetical protein BDN70DRAFT_996337 [Pholiota conissans]